MIPALEKPPLTASLLTLLGVAILCMLGTWQLHRLQWKEGLLQTIETEYARDARTNPLSAVSTPMQRGTVTGVYAQDKTILIAPRTYKGEPGYHVITPLTLSTGHSVLINRGWVPLGGEHSYSTPAGPIEITGLLRAPERGNIFTPDNRPDQNQWYRLAPSEISQAQNISQIWPNILYAEAKSGSDSAYPYAIATRPQLNNNHLHYAIFWFAMAGVLVIIYALRFLKPQPS